jgi:hypothetical protein
MEALVKGDFMECKNRDVFVECEGVATHSYWDGERENYYCSCPICFKVGESLARGIGTHLNKMEKVGTQ